MAEPVSNISRRRADAKRTPSAQYRQMRDDLAEVAAKLFDEFGYDRTTLQDIADALEINRSSIYYYVASKEELLTEVVHKSVQESVETAERIRDEQKSSEEKVSEIIGSLMDSYAENYPYLYVWVQEDVGRLIRDRPDRDTELADLAVRYRNAVQSIVAEGMENGSFAPIGDPRVITFAIIGMVNWTYRWFKPHGTLSAHEVAESFSTMALHGLLQSR